ncbi:VWA domain-containing protein [Corynebacterium urealyticum]|uniref:VWA domain-containing protein n=1 Tax=Corynebacterium urealyticum TaxID=43771 RepID=A0A5D4FZ45_9CORY|nr:VWA domain-containing protein [Corynebacterium urealyticum]TYR20559.1 VWA domain-containing protein [Corynebacterium urealyticum]
MWARRSVGAILAFVVGTILAVAVPVGVANADIDKPKKQRVHLVMDSSGSMAEKIDGGKTRIDAAKDALNSLVDSTPEETELGLRVYGANDKNKGSEESCRDSELVVPIATGNREDLSKAIEGYSPAGWTPISYALKEAGKDIGKPGEDEENTIVLVSDGEETCVPDPCDVVDELQKQGINVTINVVGMNVDGKARNQLQCIAKKGNGKYYSADNADEIKTAIEEAAMRTGQAFQLDGDPITGGDSRSEAPDMRPGTYLDKFGFNETRWYRVPKQAKDSVVWAGAAMSLAETDKEHGSITVELVDPTSEENCARESGYGHSSGPEGLLATSLSSRECEDADNLLLKVTTEVKGEGELPVRIHLEERGAVQNLDELPEAAKAPEWEEMEVPKAPEGTSYGGDSFGNAKVIEPGAHNIAVTMGESQVFAVDLDWGQHVQVQTDLETVQKRFMAWNTRVLSPFGSDALVNDTDSSDFGSGKSVSLKARTYPIRYKNSGEIYPNENSLPGRYFIIVSGGEREDTADKHGEAKGTMTVEVLDKAGEGAPEFASFDKDLGEEQDDGAADAKNVAAEQEDDGMSWPMIGAAGVGIIALLAAIVLAVTGRKKS